MAVPAMTNNSPVAGSITWDAFTIQYLGVAYSIDAGSTAKKWVWWRYNGGNSVIEADDAIPADLTDDDLVLFGNKNGIAARIQSATLIDGELIVDGSIFADALAANAITTEHLLAANALVSGLLEVGETVSEAVATAGLTIGNQTWNTETGLTIPDVMQIPATDALSALLWAKFIARELTIENYFKLQGAINEISQGASLALANGVSTPTNKPTAVSEWEVAQQLSYTGSGTVADFRGLVRHPTDPTTWYTVRGIDQYSSEVLKFTNGAIVARRTITHDGQGGIAYAPVEGRLYVCESPYWFQNQSGTNGSPSNSSCSIISLDLNLTASQNERFISTEQRSYPGDGIRWNSGVQIYPYNNTYFMVAGYSPNSGGTIYGYLYEWAHSRTNEKAYGDSIFIDSGSKYTVTGLNYGKPIGDVASNYGGWLIWGKNQDPIYNRDTGTGTVNQSPRANGRTVLGSYQDVANSTYYSLDNTGAIYKYQTAPVTGQIAYAFYDGDAGGTGLHETALSPITTLSISRGARPKITAVPPPDTGDVDSPDRISVVGRVGTSGTWYRQGFIIPPAQSLSINALAQATAYGTVATFAAAGGAASRLFSAAADTIGSLIELKGDGSGRVGPYSWDSTGKMLTNGVKSGIVDSGTLVANTAKDLAVVFTNPFPTGVVPVIVVTGSVAGDPAAIQVSQYGGSRTGFTLRIKRSNTTSFDIHWMAMPPSQ